MVALDFTDPVISPGATLFMSVAGRGDVQDMLASIVQHHGEQVP